MSRLFIIVLMVIFALTGAGLWLYFVYGTGGGQFREELSPELVVFCIEAFFLVGLLGLIQRYLEHQRRQQMWLSLRGSFRDLLSLLDIAFLEPNTEPTSSKELEREESLSMTRDLVAVAAQLSATHMNWWIAIVDSIRRLAEARDRRAMEKAIHEMLVNIREFDRLTF